MLRTMMKALVNRCTAHPWLTIAVAVILAVLSGVYTARNFAITTDIGELISPHLDWRKRELAFDKAFPRRMESILAVVEAPSPEYASRASTALVGKLRDNPGLFKNVRELADDPFFRKNGLLFLPTDEVKRVTDGLDQAEPLIQVLYSDPSLRGMTQALSVILAGANSGRIAFDDLANPLSKFSTALEQVVAGQPTSFSWQDLLRGEPSKPSDKRRFIEIAAKLNFDALEPGKEASDAIRQAAADLKLAEMYGARVRLTGPIPIADEEFATVKEGAFVNNIATVLIVLTILWLALKSARIIVAVAITVALGLALTAAVGLMMVGALNLISIAFAVLFVGIGVDFAIQFSVRYRQERHEVDDLRKALSNAAANAGKPLTLAALATAAGFLSFLPTDYRGVSELGQIAGVGMIIAFLASVTVLPALLAILDPPGEPEPLGYKALAPIDDFMERHRIPVLVGTLAVVILLSPLLYYVEFDFNPMNLRSPKVESVATYLDLRKDPQTGASSIEVLTPNIAAARELADKLAKLPEVERTSTLETFVPQDQKAKIELIHNLGKTLEPDFNEAAEKAPTDAENVAALKESKGEMLKAAEKHPGRGADEVKRLAAVVGKLAEGSAALREKAEFVLTDPLKLDLDRVKSWLEASEITQENLPPSIVGEWVTADGRARVQALPNGDPNDNDTVRNFASAVLKVAPNATGGPISILESGHMMVNAFLHAGAWALISISILLWIALRRVGDVLLTLIPLMLAGVVTLEVCVLIGLKLNFANIIALPLLLGIGVAFKIYYIMAWRSGQTQLLQSPLTRAVFYSAMTTATAFGSLWLSSHPGTSSMGKLLALSLVTTLAAAVLFQPVLMGPPRETRDG
ncbi:MAG: MMPL family transporter [Variibacter sp.]